MPPAKNTDDTPQSIMLQLMKETHESVVNIYKILNGNGKAGLTIQVDRNTSHRKSVNKWLIFLLTPLYAGVIAFIVKLVFFGGFGS